MKVKSSGSLGAACALVAVAAVAGCHSGGGSGSAARQTPSHPAAASTHTPTAGASPTTSRSAPTPSVQRIASTSPAAPPNTVTLGNARLTLPQGWTAGFEHPKGGSGSILPTWCLSATPLPSPVYVGQQCAAQFSDTSSSPLLGGFLLDVDTEGGLVSNPEYCGPGLQGTGSLLSYGDSRLGNRPADYRRWLFVCKDGKRWQIEQYVADNAPGFILFSDHADASVHAALTSIAASAVLPAMSGPLRLSDLGIVRTLRPLPGGGFHITLDRVVRGMTGLINNNPATYAYDVPATASPGAAPPRVGALIEVFTDGSKVTSYQLPPA